VITPDDVDDTLKKDILGSRRSLLFVEGEEQSLDKPIYSLLFPAASVIAKQTRRDVEHAVQGVRDSSELHWLRAFGIVDSDNRDLTEIAKLKSRGIYAVPAVSVESIYYHPFMQKRVSERQSAVTGGSATSSLKQAKSEALLAISAHAQRLSERVVEARIRADLMTKLPRRKDIAAAQPITVNIDVPSIVAAEEAALQLAIAAGNLAFIVSRYPIRETPALGSIARGLGFQDRTQYENAVRQLLIDEEAALNFVRGLFGSLVEDISAA
jgi:hypothetical protein